MTAKTIPSSPTAPTRSANASAIVVSRITMSAGLVVFLSFDGRTAQIIPYATRRTLTNPRAPKKSANTPITSAAGAFEPGQVGRAGDRLGDEATDPGLAGEVAGILVGSVGGHAEADDEHEDVRDEVEKDAEGHRAGDHRAPRRRVVLDGAERGVDPRRSRPSLLEPCPRVVDGARHPLLLVAHPATRPLHAAGLRGRRGGPRRARLCVPRRGLHARHGRSGARPARGATCWRRGGARSRSPRSTRRSTHRRHPRTRRPRRTRSCRSRRSGC